MSGGGEVRARVEWAVEALELGETSIAISVLRDLVDDLEPPDRKPVGMSPAVERVDGRIDHEGLRRVAGCIAEALGLDERRAA